MKKISLILAVDEKNGLGKNNKLAWSLSSDLKYFKNITSSTKDLGKLNAVVMGKNTWESIPEKFRPLPNRVNCILSKTIKFESIKSKIDDFVIYFNSIESCIEELNKKANLESIFVIGGANIYNQFLNHKNLDKIYLTKVYGDYGCDVFFSGIPENFILESESELLEENSIKFKFLVYKKIS